MISDLQNTEELPGLPGTDFAVEEATLGSGLTSLEQRVWRRQQALRTVAAAVEAERRRIGQDLHDDLCQQLGATALIAASVAKRISLKDEALGQELSQVPRLINAAIGRCRDLARGLHPVTLPENGLPAALEELTQRTPVDVKFRWPLGRQISLEPATAMQLYRIAEEAVSNAVKHAEAKSITIDLEVSARRPILIVHDDGKGFDISVKTNGMGLRNMRDRARAIGAQLTIEGCEGGGTRVRCRFPVANETLRKNGAS